MNNDSKTVSTAVALGACVLTAASLYVAACVGLSRDTSRDSEATDSLAYIVKAVGVELPSSIGEDITAHGGINACATQDASNCYWDASVHGAGVGVSYVTWQGHMYYGADITVAPCGADPQPAYTSASECVTQDNSIITQ